MYTIKIVLSVKSVFIHLNYFKMKFSILNENAYLLVLTPRISAPIKSELVPKKENMKKILCRLSVCSLTNPGKVDIVNEMKCYEYNKRYTNKTYDKKKDKQFKN